MLLPFLSHIHAGKEVDPARLEDVLSANKFFVDFYSSWDGCTRDILRQALVSFDQPELLSAGLFPSRLAKGFRQALDEIEIVQQRLTWLQELDLSRVAERILDFLPADTPLDRSSISPWMISTTLSFTNMKWG